jgi:hypothetical protein
MRLHIQTNTHAHTYRRGLPFIGMRNPGARCYINAMVQQMYSIDAFREAIIMSSPSEEGLNGGQKEDDVWSCSACTMSNDWGVETCETCGTGSRCVCSRIVYMHTCICVCNICRNIHTCVSDVFLLCMFLLCIFLLCMFLLCMCLHANASSLTQGWDLSKVCLLALRIYTYEHTYLKHT